jgi:cell division septum initiation protein DivIVA
VLSQENDAGARSAAGDHRGDSSGQIEVPGQRSPSAARLLEMTARDTDQWRSDARAEAAEIVAAARDEADALVRSAQREAADLVEAARLEAARAETEVARLQQVAADHAQHLRHHLNDVLDRLDSAPTRSQLDRDDSRPG